MKLYLAGRYGRRSELARYAEQLQGRGHEITARWLAGVHEAKDEIATVDEQAEWAMEDLDDILASDEMLLFVDDERGRGGHNVELGYALAMDIPVTLIGQRVNVFHCSPGIDHFEHWEAYWFAQSRPRFQR